MNHTMNAQKSLTHHEAKEQLKQQLARHLEQQTQFAQASHRWMKRLEVASLGMVIAFFLAAMFVSTSGAAWPKIAIPVAWITFAASTTLPVMLYGLHAVLLRAYPPVIIPGKAQRFYRGSSAILFGWGTMLLGLILAASCGFLAYTVATFNLALLVPVINVMGVVMGVTMAAAMLLAMVQQFTKSR
jgi:hypothetical protein